MKIFRSAAFLIVASTFAMAWCEARSVAPIQFEIQEQPLGSALQVYSIQARVQVLRRDEDVSLQGLVAPAVSGTLSAEQALRQLLTGSGFTFEFINDKTVKILHGELQVAQVGSPAARPPAPSPSTATANATTPSREATGAQLEEVVVTAQKREERIQDVPISISVLSGRQLDHSTVEGATEALSQIPGVAPLVEFQGGGTSIAIRGVSASATLFSGSSPVSYYLDSVPFGFVNTALAPDANVYDLSRVEVLRGPQGTLYGANAQNGVVKVLTNDAALGVTEFKTKGLLSDSQQGGMNYRADAAVNLPLGDKVAVRGVVGYQDFDGWIDKPNDKGANDSQIANYRLKLNAEPIEHLSIGLSAWSSRSDFGAPSVAGDDGKSASLIDESISTDYDVYGFKLGYELPNFAITAVTGYLSYDNSGGIDSQPFGFPGKLITKFDATVLSQEVLLNSLNDRDWHWSLGAMYRDAKDRLRSSFPPYLLTDSGGVNKSKSTATYGELTRRLFGNAVEITGGLRYFSDDVDQRDLAGTTATSASFNHWSPRVVFAWHPVRNTTIYASYSEGFRSGFSQSADVLAIQPNFPAAKPDTLHNYELGAKGSLFDGRVEVDSAVYFVDWRDVQQKLQLRNSAGVPFNAIINGPSASGAGFEASLTGKVTDRLVLGLNFSWNDLTMDEDIFAGGNVLLFAKGDRLNQSPKYTAGATADYTFPLAAALTGRLSASGNYTSRQDERTVDGGIFSIGLGDPIFIARAGFAVESDKWVGTLFVDNITDEDRAVWREESGVPVWAGRVRPRTFGVQLEYRF